MNSPPQGISHFQILNFVDRQQAASVRADVQSVNDAELVETLGLNGEEELPLMLELPRMVRVMLPAGKRNAVSATTHLFVC